MRDFPFLPFPFLSFPFLPFASLCFSFLPFPSLSFPSLFFPFLPFPFLFFPLLPFSSLCFSLLCIGIDAALFCLPFTLPPHTSPPPPPPPPLGWCYIRRRGVKRGDGEQYQAAAAGDGQGRFHRDRQDRRRDALFEQGVRGQVSAPRRPPSLAHHTLPATSHVHPPPTRTPTRTRTCSHTRIPSSLPSSPPSSPPLPSSVSIVVSKSSELNVLVPDGEDGDFKEIPLPEQFVSEWDDATKNFITKPAEHGAG